MMREAKRLDFIEDRDGVDGAVEFAKRAMKQYRKAVLTSRKRGYEKPHFGSLPEYRRKFIESYCEFKRYISVIR